MGRTRGSSVVVAGALLAASLVTLPDPAPVARDARAAPEPGRLGTNVGAVNYYDGTVPFNDLVDQASDWIPQREGAPWGTGDPLVLRADGWPARLKPGQYATTVLADVTYPAGEYRVSWTGKGRIEVNGTAFSARGAGSGVVSLDGESMVLLDVVATDRSDPVRDVSVRPTGVASDDVFRQGYLDQLEIYGVLRFMDWQRTNSVPWADQRRFDCRGRVTPGFYSQGTEEGVSVERMVDLANAVDADPWFTIPEEATRAWIRCHAQVVVARLESELVPRYEFSNETWNPAFRAFHDLRDQAVEAGLGDGDDFLGLQIRVGQRHVRAMRVVAKVFRAADRPVRRVMSGQAANSWVLEQRLLTPGVLRHTDEVAIAPYLGVPSANPFDPDEADELAQLTPAELFEQLATAQSTEVDVWIRDHVALAESRNKDLVSYEGGQHLAGDPENARLTRLFTSANASPAMGDAYTRYLDRWAELTGNQLMVHFTDIGPASRYGSWGALTSWDRTTSPKYEALRAFASAS